MRKILETSRRSFLRLLGLLGLSLTGWSLRKARPNPAALDSCQALSAGEVKTLEALADQIVPQDDFPGAVEAGVVRYIDNALSTGQGDRLLFYRAGLAAVNEASRAEYKKVYHELPFDRQTELLEKIEMGKAPGKLWEKVPQRDFFRILRLHTLEGYYGPPQYGGNKDYISWKMVGFPKLAGLEAKIKR